MITLNNLITNFAVIITPILGLIINWLNYSYTKKQKQLTFKNNGNINFNESKIEINQNMLTINKKNLQNINYLSAKKQNLKYISNLIIKTIPFVFLIIYINNFWLILNHKNVSGTEFIHHFLNSIYQAFPPTIFNFLVLLSVLSIITTIKKGFFDDEIEKVKTFFYFCASLLYIGATYLFHYFPNDNIDVFNSTNSIKDFFPFFIILILIFAIFFNLKLVETIFQFNDQKENSKLLSVLIPKLLISIFYFLFPIIIVIFYNCI